MFSEQKDLYTDEDPVTILDDDSFVGKNCKIRKDTFKTHGFLKAYAPWCGHCQAKVDCIKRLGKVLKDYDVTVYVINAEREANPLFNDHFGDRVRGFPTFLEVDGRGNIGEVMRTKDGEQVYSVPSIIAALCGNDTRICQYAEIMKDCS